MFVALEANADNRYAMCPAGQFRVYFWWIVQQDTCICALYECLPLFDSERKRDKNIYYENIICIIVFH